MLHDFVTPVPNLVTPQGNGVTEYHNPSTRLVNIQDSTIKYMGGKFMCPAESQTRTSDTTYTSSGL